MQTEDIWAIGVDLGGSKVSVALVDAAGHVLERRLFATKVRDGHQAIEADVIEAVLELRRNAPAAPIGVGIGVAGQIDPVSGSVRFSPNLNWRDVPLKTNLGEELDMPICVTNDVRAATWGEWVYGAGQGCNDLVCLFVGTGIGGGVVSAGRMLTGCSNTAGELGHITVDLHGPICQCGNRGCLEALAGGTYIARQARAAVGNDPSAGSALLLIAGGRVERITAKVVAEAAGNGDPLASHLVDKVAEALIAGSVSLVNAFNPCRLILGGGVIEGIPELVHRIEAGVQQRALVASSAPLQVLPSQLRSDAGVIGAAIMALRELTVKDPD